MKAATVTMLGSESDERTGLDWAGLAGLGWAGLGCAWLGWTVMDWTGLAGLVELSGDNRDK